MTEILSNYPETIYMGEDVTHGGYYLVTEGLQDSITTSSISDPETTDLRVRDYPPDEGVIIGIGMGYAQSGLIPIVEMPYAKYLDCGADMFFEMSCMSWLSNRKQPNGMI